MVKRGDERAPGVKQYTVDRTRIPLATLAWPLFVENLLRTSLMSVDTFMLSRYSQKAVAAMSLVNQFAFLIQLLYMMAAIGASILISQNLGAGRRRDAGLVGVGSLALILGLSIVLSAMVALAAGPVLSLYDLDPDVARYGRQFLTIYGGLSMFMAFNIGQACILRAWGHPRDPMLVNITALLLTVGGNALCLFGPFGFPVLGVPGVAASTVASQAVACVLYTVLLQRRKEIDLPVSRMRSIPRSVYSRLLSVGVPTAGENLSYNLSQIVILSMVARMGTEALAGYGILISILRYVFIAGDLHRLRRADQGGVLRRRRAAARCGGTCLPLLRGRVRNVARRDRGHQSLPASDRRVVLGQRGLSRRCGDRSSHRPCARAGQELQHHHQPRPQGGG